MGARFFPPEGGLMAVAIIDPTKAHGVDGQYRKFEGLRDAMLARAEEARAEGFEVRLYYRGLENDQGDKVASVIIETWIPPGHVQPFHTHKTLDEVTLVTEGSILAIDSPYMTENDVRLDLRAGDRSFDTVVPTHGVVVEGPGTRHTVANPTDAYATLVTVQTARMPIDSFPSDWERDGKTS